jgi:hypothetical protein
MLSDYRQHRSGFAANSLQFAALVIAAGLIITPLQLLASVEQEVGVTAASNIDAIGKPPVSPARDLDTGVEVYFQEVVSTDTNGRAQLLFQDGTALTVGPGSDLVIDEYVYDPATVAVRGGIAYLKEGPNGVEAALLFGDKLSMTSSSTGLTTTTFKAGRTLSLEPGAVTAPKNQVTSAKTLASVATAMENKAVADKQGGASGSQPNENESAQAKTKQDIFTESENAEAAASAELKSDGEDSQTKAGGTKDSTKVEAEAIGTLKAARENKLEKEGSDPAQKVSVSEESKGQLTQDLKAAVTNHDTPYSDLSYKSRS